MLERATTNQLNQLFMDIKAMLLEHQVKKKYILALK
jgi:hypothetical protein